MRMCPWESPSSISSNMNPTCGLTRGDSLQDLPAPSPRGCSSLLTIMGGSQCGRHPETCLENPTREADAESLLKRSRLPRLSCNGQGSVRFRSEGRPVDRRRAAVRPSVSAELEIPSSSERDVQFGNPSDRRPKTQGSSGTKSSTERLFLLPHHSCLRRSRQASSAASSSSLKIRAISKTYTRCVPE